MYIVQLGVRVLKWHERTAFEKSIGISVYLFNSVRTLIPILADMFSDFAHRTEPRVIVERGCLDLPITVAMREQSFHCRLQNLHFFKIAEANHIVPLQLHPAVVTKNFNFFTATRALFTPTLSKLLVNN